jgi:hypothetical protein
LAVPTVILGELSAKSGVRLGTVRKWFDRGLLGVRTYRIGLYRAIDRPDLPAALERISELKRERCVPAA